MSPLLQLPAELRNQIYHHALVAGQRIDVTGVTSPKEPGLLATCKQIRSEAQSTYYTDNVFHVVVDLKQQAENHHWLKALGETRVGLVKELRIEGPSLFGDKPLTKDYLQFVQQHGIERVRPGWVIAAAKQSITALEKESGINIKALKPIAPEEITTVGDLYQKSFASAAQEVLRKR